MAQQANKALTHFTTCLAGVGAKRNWWLLSFILLAGMFLGAACVHRPFRHYDDIIDPALCALNDTTEGRDSARRRIVKYMFCVPHNAFAMAEVRQVDPTVVFVPRAQARGLCPASMQLCVGNTGQTSFKEVLERLARLPYVDKIELAPSDLY